MTITTKAALADELGVTRARVSQYVKAGLPVRSDGKLDRDEALNWLNRNVVGLNREQDRGVNRAARLAKPLKARMKPERYPPPPAEDELDGLSIIAELVAQSGAIAARTAAEAGATMQIAYAMDQAVCVHLWLLAEKLLGIPRGGDPHFEKMVDSRIVSPDWAVLADAAGEDLDQDAWAAFSDALPSLQPDPA